tara:strand:+ start:106 stop:390 length:285 start_codon:yes stop_codon:yes gene_type:complete
MKIIHKEIVEDYNKLIKMYEVPEDLTGGMVVEEHLMKAVLKGTKVACGKAILDIIYYGFQRGDGSYRYQSGGSYKEIHFTECSYIKYIYYKYIY